MDGWISATAKLFYLYSAFVFRHMLSTLCSKNTRDYVFDKLN